MKLEVLSALHDYEAICRNPYKYTPKQLKRLEKELEGYIIPKEWVIIECLESATEFKLDDYGRAEIYGGVYKVTDEIIDKQFVLDLNRGIMKTKTGEHEFTLSSFNALNNIFIYDYTDFPHVLIPIKEFGKRGSL